MDKYTYKQAMRKIIWATKKETGKGKTKKMISQAADMVMAMQPKAKANWRGESKPEGIANLLNKFMGEKL